MMKSTIPIDKPSSSLILVMLVPERCSRSYWSQGGSGKLTLTEPVPMIVDRAYIVR